MSVDPICPHCDTIQVPERLAPGHYLCPSCAKTFPWPPPEVTYRETSGLVSELLTGGELPTVTIAPPPLREDQLEALRRARDGRRTP